MRAIEKWPKEEVALIRTKLQHTAIDEAKPRTKLSHTLKVQNGTGSDGICFLLYIHTHTSYRTSLKNVDRGCVRGF